MTVVGPEGRSRVSVAGLFGVATLLAVLAMLFLGGRPIPGCFAGVGAGGRMSPACVEQWVAGLSPVARFQYDHPELATLLIGLVTFLAVLCVGIAVTGIVRRSAR